MDQYDAYYKLDEAMADSDYREPLPSMRALFEAMDVAGLVFAEGSQAETIARMDREDAEA